MSKQSKINDLAAALIENEQDKKLRELLIDWEDKLAPITRDEQELYERLDQLHREAYFNADDYSDDLNNPDDVNKSKEEITHSESDIPSESFIMLLEKSRTENNEKCNIEHPTQFVEFYENVENEIHNQSYDKYKFYAEELTERRNECDVILLQINSSQSRLHHLKKQYEFIENKTQSLNQITEKLTNEQKTLNEKSEEIKHRLYYFNQAEIISQKLQSPTLSVASDTFKDCLNKIDDCIEYLKANPKFKESNNYLAKYKHCLAKAVLLIKNYVNHIMTQAIEHISAPAKIQDLTIIGQSDLTTSSDAAFALYYGKFQTTAVKIKKISLMIEERINKCPDYEQLLSELHQNYLTERANLMSPAVEKSIKDLKIQNKNDHCTLIRSACAFLVHVCQDEYRLFYQFFAIPTDQINSYLEGLCTILYDTLRPYIIHIIHLETLAEICSILRIEMIEEHVQQNPEPLETFGNIAVQLLHDVQERLVFRAHLYLQSDILNYNPSPGDLAYPDKLEMMESIALSLQEPHLKRSDSHSSLVSSASAFPDSDSVIDGNLKGRYINSPADLHGMWYPTVRRTLVCLSRLYRCLDRQVFQGLSQEAIVYCIQSVSKASQKIATNKSFIDAELFEIKHLLILREQIAPFRVDFTIKETALDFSKVKTAAYGLIQKRKQLFSMGSNNAILEFLLDGTPLVKDLVKDSRKDVDRQLKTICEQFIKDAVQMLIGSILNFLEKAQIVVATDTTALAAASNAQLPQKLNYQLRQSSWASPQQISGYIQESQRLIKNKLASLQRSMQLYLSNRDTELIIFRPIRNNIINAFVKIEQILTTNGYTADDMIITSCPTADQVAILISSASLVGDAKQHQLQSVRKISTSSNEESSISRKISIEKKISFDNNQIVQEEEIPLKEEIVNIGIESETSNTISTTE